MLKNVVLGFVFFFFVFCFSHIIVKSQELKIESKQVAYTLPYPGILPDNQLYPIKLLRDNFLCFFTRDSLKKAELELGFADKKVSMALELANKNKWVATRKILQEAENHYYQIIKNINLSEKQGGGVGGEFISKVELSNAKHKSVIEGFLKNIPEGEIKNFESILKTNKDIKEKLNKIKH